MLAALLFKCVVLIFAVSAQQNAVSPCPRLFVYERNTNEPNTWYGLLTLLSETDLKGVWIRFVFDRPSLQLGNWFGKVSTTDHVEYLLKNREFELKAYSPETVRFFIKYDASQPVPRLLSIRLNAKVVCPEPTALAAPTTAKLETSDDVNSRVTTPNPPKNAVNRHEVGIPDSESIFENPIRQLFNQPGPAVGSGFSLGADCGTVIAQPQLLIAHGHATHEGEFPWHAAIYHVRGIDLAYVCGASLVSRFHLISAAHCVTKKGTHTALEPENMLIYLGKHHLKHFASIGIQDRQVSAITPHPRFSASVFNDDIAVVKLTQPADITDYVRPICLWQDSVDVNAIINKEGTVVGWGFDETGKLTSELKQTRMPVVSLDTCLYSYREFFARFTNFNTFCAGYKNGTSVCNGDSGGGMAFKKANSNAWQLRGIVSLSVSEQGLCDPNHYAVFTDAAKYLGWIKQVMLL